MEQIFIVIPAYEPDTRLLDLLKNIKGKNLGLIILINDGSSSKYTDIFNKASNIMGTDGITLTHDLNRGKGRTLKTVFTYILDNYPNAIGVVTADSDGQHTTDAVEKIMKTLSQKTDGLILGVRDFSEEGILWKSRWGNKLTENIFAYLAGVHISDTQPGLRGIPKSFMQELLNIRGERFEFEMRMLLESAGKYPITEVVIETIYDSVDNHQTHFNPILDSIRIYRILGEKFLRYIAASLSSFIIDIVIFSTVLFFKQSQHQE